jgi:serine phosphatase RsbU (regulator of sigma subunit)
MPTAGPTTSVSTLRSASPQAGFALHGSASARASREAATRARRDLDLEAARRMQRRMMSAMLPEGVGVTAIVEYRPALGVGGDFYSLRYLGSGRVSIAIGDVAGCGISAALVMARLASDLERALGAGEAPSAVLARVGGGLADAGTETFVTASCLRLDTEARTMTVANAGHLPIAVRMRSGDVFTCGGATGTPLGIERCGYADEVIALHAGDLLLLATDGLLEALDPPGGERGQEALLGLLRDAPHDPRAVHERLCASVDEAGRAHDLDDVTWVGLQIAA